MIRLLVLLSLPPAAATEDELWVQARRAAAGFEKRTGVPMTWLEGDSSRGVDIGDGVIAFPPTALDAATSIEPLIVELSIYPEAFLERSGLKRVVVARGLERNGQPYGGFAYPSGPKKGTLLVSLGSLQWAAMAIHHEVFHLTHATKTVEALALAFRACNPPEFTYAAEGPIDRTRPRIATITDYARTAFGEDLAETFAWTVVDAAFAQQQARQDPAIDCKVKQVKAFVKALDPRFDDERWRKLASRKPGTPLP
jgi:hypothetical protein